MTSVFENLKNILLKLRSNGEIHSETETVILPITRRVLNKNPELLKPLFKNDYTIVKLILFTNDILSCGLSEINGNIDIEAECCVLISDLIIQKGLNFKVVQI